MRRRIASLCYRATFNRLIFKLNHISGTTERLFFNRFKSSSYINCYQPAYRKYRSTETAVFATLNSTCNACDQPSSTFLMAHHLTHLSALLTASFWSRDWRLSLAQKALLCSTLICLLSVWPLFLCLNWQLRSRNLETGAWSSARLYLGSCPICFIYPTQHVAFIISCHDLIYRQQADDTQMFFSLAPSFVNNCSKWEKCLRNLQL